MDKMIANLRHRKKFLLLVLFLVIACAINILGARYYRLLENERKVFVGLRGIDSVAAIVYLDLPSATERGYFYERFWQGKDEAKKEFESRIEYAYREFGRYAPLSDDRIPIYVKYGLPSRRQIITPQKMIAITSKEAVKPAEIWTYKKDGLEFDFIRIARAYKAIAQTEFGDRMKVSYLKEETLTTFVKFDSTGVLNFDVGYGRFRQKKNLTRLEVYLNVEIADTADLAFVRDIKVFDQKDSLIAEKKKFLKPRDGEKGIFYDEVNFWLEPQQYLVLIDFFDLKNKKIGRKEIFVDLLEYTEDAKEISDLIAARLIDESFSDERFNKTVGRVIPLARAVSPINLPFYFYHEVYNLETKDGMHQLRTTYEIYNKERMRKEIVDILILDRIEDGNIAYLSAKYHPMDLAPGRYLVVAKDKDLLSNKERTAVGEFELIAK